MTAKQFVQLGEDPPGVRLELVDGQVAVSPGHTPEHSHCEGSLSALLCRHVRHGRGMILTDLNVTLDVYNVRRPDILYYSSSRRHLVQRDRLVGVPDLCVEVVDLHSATVDRVDKFEQYASAGVAYYWLLDPMARSLEGFRCRRGTFASIGQGRGGDVISLPPFRHLKVPLSLLWWRALATSSHRRTRNTLSGQRDD